MSFPSQDHDIALSSFGQRLPVAPFALAGLTRKTVCALTRED